MLHSKTLERPVTLVTGFDGFVGKHLLNNDLNALPLVDPGNNQKVDITNKAHIETVIAKLSFSSVVHLAAQSSVSTSFLKPEDTFKCNFMGTFYLLETLKKMGFNGVFLYVSSCDCYGQTEQENLPITEDFPLFPRSPYAVSKVAAEALCHQYNAMSNIDIRIARPFSHIGPGQSPSFVISKLAKKLIEIKLKKSPATIQVGDLSMVKDFTDVRDVIAAYQILLTKGERGEIYNICSGKGISLNSVFDQLKNISGVDCEPTIDASLLRPNESKTMIGSAEKLQRKTQWKPQYTIERTLSDMLQYWEKELA